MGFGLDFISELLLDQLEAVSTPAAGPGVTVRVASKPLPLRRETCRWGRSAICHDGLRFGDAGDEALIDLWDGREVVLWPGSGWRGAVPQEFYGTIMAVLLATSERVPIHGTAIEFKGRAILLCGRAGAGKSSIGAWLVAQGARLISDDLSALGFDACQAPQVFPGRLDFRLAAPAVQMLRSTTCEWQWHTITNESGKVRACPPRVSGLAPVPLALIVHLGPCVADGIVDELVVRAQLLRTHLFRPHLLERLPSHPQRLSALLMTATLLPLLCLKTPAEMSTQHVAALAARIMEEAVARE